MFTRVFSINTLSGFHVTVPQWSAIGVIMIKYGDVKKLVDAGLISTEQQARINAHYSLKEDESRFLKIISYVGGALVAAGIVLLISSNWDEIPRWVKLGAGLAIMLGAHAGGWYLREVKGAYLKSGEALHLVGSLMFLANIALVGQIYHLSSRPPTAIALWVLGIAALPWLLRSKPQWMLFLVGLGIWFGMELNQNDSPLYYGNDTRQLVMLAAFSLVYLGVGYVLRGTRFSSFSGLAEKLGLFGFLCFSYPLTWGVLYSSSWGARTPVAAWSLPVFLVLGAVLFVVGSRNFRELTPQWRWTWLGTLAGAILLLGAAVAVDPGLQRMWTRELSGFRWFATIGLFVFCLIQAQVGIQDRSEYMVNLAVLFIALNIIATYLNVLGSMAVTGAMFVISGVFLIAFGFYLEKKRRSLLARLRAAPGATLSPSVI